MKKKLYILFLIIVFCFSGLIGYHLYHCFFPMVSIVMPTYNRAPLLTRSIHSILNQTYPYFELIIVDDGSTDNTSQVVQSFIKKDSRIRYIKLDKNCGVSCARNTGNTAARGRFIAVMDSDDESLPDRLIKQAAYLIQHPDVAVITANKIHNAARTYRSTNPQEILYRLHFDNIVGNPEAMFRRDFINHHNIRYNNDYAAAEDYDFWKQIVFAGGTIHRLEDVVIKCYTQPNHPNSYYQKMGQFRRQVSIEFLNQYGINWNGNRMPTCELLHQMRQNADKGFLSLIFLEHKALQCPPHP